MFLLFFFFSVSLSLCLSLSVAAKGVAFLFRFCSVFSPCRGLAISGKNRASLRSRGVVGLGQSSAISLFLIYFQSSPISFPENLPTRCLFFLPPQIFSRARTDFFLFFLLRFTHRPPPLSRLSLLPSRSSSPCLIYRTHFSPSYLSPFFFVLFWELSPHCLSLLFVGLLSLKLPSLYFYFFLLYSWKARLASPFF